MSNKSNVKTVPTEPIEAVEEPIIETTDTAPKPPSALKRAGSWISAHRKPVIATVLAGGLLFAANAFGKEQGRKEVLGELDSATDDYEPLSEPVYDILDYSNMPA